MKNHAEWKRAQRILSGGVNSPVRAFRAVGGDPVFIEKGEGPYLIDTAGNRYLDYCLSWGALLGGHAPKAVVDAVARQAAKGTSFGTCTPYETRLAERIRKSFPGMERIRFTSSGTEAAMAAIRLARGVTGRPRVVKFEGCYHGSSDGLLVKAGSGAATFGAPTSAGVPPEIGRLTSVLPFNDEKAAAAFLKKRRDVACVIVEPVAGNMGVVPATKAFLETLRRGTSRRGAMLIFDEVITGFRVGPGGAQALYRIRPDLTILGKIIGGGLPVGAFGGPRKWMEELSPLGRVYQAGTLSGNPLSMAAGLAALDGLSGAFYAKLGARAERFADEAGWRFRQKKTGAVVQRVGSMFTVFFAPRAPRNFTEAAASDTRRFGKFFRRALARKIYLPPSAFEACFVSSAHEDRHLRRTLEAFERC